MAVDPRKFRERPVGRTPPPEPPLPEVTELADPAVLAATGAPPAIPESLIQGPLQPPGGIGQVAGVPRPLLPDFGRIPEGLKTIAAREQELAGELVPEVIQRIVAAPSKLLEEHPGAELALPFGGGSVGVFTDIKVLRTLFGLRVARKLKAKKLPKVPAAPVVEEPSTPLTRTFEQWSKPIEPPKVPVKQRAVNAYIKMQEELTDQLARGNRVSGIARKEYLEKTGRQLPPELDFEIQGAFLGAADAKGLARFGATQKRVQDIIGTDVNPRDVEAFLHLRHGIDIMRSKGPKRVIPGGIKTINEAEGAVAELATRLGPERFGRVERAAIEWRNLGRDLLEQDVAEGFVTRQLADDLIQTYPWYTPIKYQEALAAHGESGGGRALSVTSSGLKRLSEVGSEEARELPTASLLRHAIQAETRVQRNRAAKALIHNMQLDPSLEGQVTRVNITRPVAEVEGKPVFRPPKGEVRGTMSVMEGGKRQIWRVPEEFEQMAKRIGQMPLNDVNAIVRAIQMPFRHAFVTYNPAFMGAQAFFDTATVMTTRGVMPWEVATSFLRNLRGLIKFDPEMNQIMREGGSVVGWHGRTARQIAESYAKTGNVTVYSPGTAKKFLTRPWEALRELGFAIEIAPRRATFRRLIKQGKSPQEAALAFRRATVDFQRIGTSMRLANNYFLFLNPAVQGSMLPFRALRDVKVAKYGLVGLMGAAASVYAWNRQFPEYADIPLFDKYGGLVIMLPSNEFDKRGKKVPKYIKMPPMLRELAFFTGPVTYLLGRLDGTAPETTSQFLIEMVRQLNPASQIAGGGLPVPTEAGELIVEIGLNRDTFRDRPIVPPELEGLLPEQQFDEKTSEVAKRLGGYLGFSPMKIDHILKQGISWDIIGAADAMIRVIDGGEDPYIEGLTERLREIQEIYSGDQIPLQRRKFLASLSRADKDAVLEAERTPQPRVPFLESIMRRFYRKQAGNIWQSGQARAAQQTGFSKKQTQTVSRNLGLFAQEMATTQEKMDDGLKRARKGDPTGIGEGQWRESNKAAGMMWQGFLLGQKIFYPRAAQIGDNDAWADYQRQINTLAGGISDRRSKAEILVAGFNAIQPKELAPGVLDWDTFFTQRDGYRDSLSTGDKTLLETWRRLGMTDVQAEYDRALEVLRPYFQLSRQLIGIAPKMDATYQAAARQYEEYLDVVRRDSQAGADFLRDREIVRAFQSNIIGEAKLQLRARNKEIDATLKLWDFTERTLEERFGQ